MRKFELFLENLKKEGKLDFVKEKPLFSVSTMGVGGKADIFVLPNGAETFCEVTAEAKKQGIPFICVGNSSNIIYSDEGFQGALICTKNMKGYRVRTEKNGIKLTVGCGTMLSELCQIAYENGVSGFEGLCSIPGTVGGTVMSNAGAYGYSISDCLTGLFLLNGEGKIVFRRVWRNDFAYRECHAVKVGETVLGAVFSLENADKNEIFEKIRKFREMRRKSQPCGFKSAGSFFKRPTEFVSAGELIDRCGLKGLSVGGAEVSEKHANFIINSGGASAKDVLELAQKVRKKVFYDTGILLEKEVIFVGDFGEVFV